MIYAAILAGGTGTRMGAAHPKQFLEFGGRPVIIHTTERFLRHEQIDRVIVVTPEMWCGYTERLLAEYFGNSGIIVAVGGETRNETLMNAIAAIEAEGNLNDDTIIVTHDAVRPFVTEEMISGNIFIAEEIGACETAFPSTDTIVETDDGKLVKSVPDRSRLWMVQTPQSFRAKKLRELYMSLTEDEKAVLTDAARIYVMKDEAVGIVKGDSSNIKITYPEDLQIAESILNKQHKQD